MSYVGEITNYIAKLYYKLVILYSCNITSFSQIVKIMTAKVSKEDYNLLGKA